MSERRDDSDFNFWLLFPMIIIVIIAASIKFSEVRDLQRRVGQLESGRR